LSLEACGSYLDCL